MNLTLSNNFITQIKALTNSTYLDIIGLIIVISVSIILEYYKTVFNFNFNGKSYVFFLGYISIINTSF
jgi:hypothetical protein